MGTYDTKGGFPLSPDEQAEEDANVRACEEAAQKAGYPFWLAEECEDGELNCPTCPWKKYARKR